MTNPPLDQLEQAADDVRRYAKLHRDALAERDRLVLECFDPDNGVTRRRMASICKVTPATIAKCLIRARETGESTGS